MMTTSSNPGRMTSPERTEQGASGPPVLALERKPTLLLHVCCGPCATHVIDLTKETYHLVGFFYNPNLFPKQEFYKRLEAAAQVFRTHRRALWVPPFDQDRWSNRVRGLEKEPEGGRRCEICIQDRLEVTAWMAATTGIEAFATTLTISPTKKSSLINTIGIDLSRSNDILFLAADFKKKNGFLKSVEKSKTLGLYRQNYCGCSFSMRGKGPDPRPGARPV